MKHVQIFLTDFATECKSIKKYMQNFQMQPETVAGTWYFTKYIQVSGNFFLIIYDMFW